MSTEELYKLLKDREFTIEDVIQAIIQINGIVGVGKISLGDTLRDFCYHRAEDYSKLRDTPEWTDSNGTRNVWEGQVWQSNHRNGTT